MTVRGAAGWGAAALRALALALALAAGGAAGCEGDGGAAAADAAGDVDPGADAPDAGPDAPDPGPADAGPGDPGGDAAVPLAAEAGPDRYALVGEEVVLDGSATTGAVAYRWDFGNGERQDEAGPDPVARVTYGAPGRYAAVLSAWDAAGKLRTDAVLISVTGPVTFQPRPSSTVAAIPGTDRVAVVSADADALTLVERAGDDTFSVAARHPVPGTPRTVTPWGDWLLVPCQEAATLRVLRHDGSGEAHALPLPPASRPYGATWAGDAAFVTLQATGRVAEVALAADGTPSLAALHDVIEDGRAISALPDGRIAVSRWRSPDARGEIGVLDPATGEVALWTLAFDPTLPSDTETGGLPSYLGPVLVPPTGGLAAVPSLQANVGHGLALTGYPLTFETTVRAVVSFVQPAVGLERFDLRKQFDNRGFAVAGAFSSRGDWLFVAMRGSRAVERFDALGGSQAGTILEAGYAPEGVALSPDDRFLYVDASLSRTLRVYDAARFESAPVPVAELPTVDAEPLPAVLLRGKQLFNDSSDPRLARDSYIACAHCHLDGEADRRTWDFTDRGEGIRNTAALDGHGGRGDPLHWSANFDEVQDFEHDLRGPFGGQGLMDDADFHAGTRDQTLGDPKAGVSPDLDALAAYVDSLTSFPPSPFRAPDGALTPEAAAGREIFLSPATGCTDCHAGPALADSGWESPGTPVLHDVGTLTPASGQRLGGPLTGLDTPTLHGLWATAPYLHDGSAATLRDVLTTRNPDDLHGVTSHLDDAALDQLVAWLRSLDGRDD